MISFASPQKIQISTDESNNLIVDGVGGDFAGMSGSIRFRLLVNVELDGQCDVLDDRLIIFSSTIVTLRIVLATSYINYSNVNGDEIKLSDTLLHSSQVLTYEQLFQRHLDDYQSLFNRVQLNLGESAAMLQPTDRRIQNFAQKPKQDPQFVTLYFQFGRYLLISSSRPGSQAANLQGVWNDSMTPPWSSKYTININIEMNYWPAGPANLLECCQPLFDLIEDISHTGQTTAQLHYGTVSSTSTPHLANVRSITVRRNAREVGCAITTRISGEEQHPSTMRSTAHGRPVACGCAKASLIIMPLRTTKKHYCATIPCFVRRHNSSSKRWSSRPIIYSPVLRCRQRCRTTSNWMPSYAKDQR